MYLIDRLEMTHRGIAAREKQLEEVKKVCVPLVRVYSVQRQSLGKMVAKEAIHFLNRDSLVQQVEKAIAMAEKGNKRITVDLRRTCFIDVSGMNALHVVV